MPGLGQSRRLSCLLVAVGMLGACVTASPAHAAKSCRAKRIAIAYKPRGRTKAKRWCVPRPRIPRSQADAAVSIVRLLERGKLSPKRLERLVRAPAGRARASVQACPRAPGPPHDEAAPRAHAAGAQRQGEIPAGPGQAGFGYFSDSSSSASAEDDEHATVRTTHRSKSRHEIFGPKCPDFDGNVVTKIAIVHTDERSSERRGKRTTITTDARITGTLSGGFTDDFEFRGPLAARPRLRDRDPRGDRDRGDRQGVDRKPTATRRVRMTASIAPQSLGALETPLEAFSAMTITGAARLARPALARRLRRRTRRSCSRSWARSALARTEAGHRLLAHDRQRRRVPVRGRHGRPGRARRWRTGRPAASPSPSAGWTTSAPCRPAPTCGSTPANLELSPVGNRIHAPASGLAFRATSRGGASVAEVCTVSAPRVRPDAEDPDQRAQIRVPGPLHRQLDAGVRRPAGRPGMVETIDGTATFVRNPLIPPEAEAIIAIPYDVESSAITWSVSGSAHRGGMHDDLQRLGHRHGHPEHLRRHGHDPPGRPRQPGRSGAGADAVLLLDPRELGSHRRAALHHHAQRRPRAATTSARSRSSSSTSRSAAAATSARRRRPARSSRAPTSTCSRATATPTTAPAYPATTPGASGGRARRATSARASERTRTADPFITRRYPETKPRRIGSASCSRVRSSRARTAESGTYFGTRPGSLSGSNTPGQSPSEASSSPRQRRVLTRTKSQLVSMELTPLLDQMQGARRNVSGDDVARLDRDHVGLAGVHRVEVRHAVLAVRTAESETPFGTRSKKVPARAADVCWPPPREKRARQAAGVDLEFAIRRMREPRRAWRATRPAGPARTSQAARAISRSSTSKSREPPGKLSCSSAAWASSRPW